MVLHSVLPPLDVLVQWPLGLSRDDMTVFMRTVMDGIDTSVLSCIVCARPFTKRRRCGYSFFTMSPYGRDTPACPVGSVACSDPHCKTVVYDRMRVMAVAAFDLEQHIERRCAWCASPVSGGDEALVPCVCDDIVCYTHVCVECGALAPIRRPYRRQCQRCDMTCLCSKRCLGLHRERMHIKTK